MKNWLMCLIVAVGSSTVVSAQSDGAGAAPNASTDSGNAETTTKPAESASLDASKPMERVEVTGSHIKRIDTEGASPVQTITRKQIEDSGVNGVGDVLRNMSVSSFGSAREASGTSTPGYAEVDLRGIGANKTLVLLDGQRLPPDAINGAVDLNLIPIAAIERIEILKDGASAIYGSDALGGVVNIITRKDFSGSEVTITRHEPYQKGGGKTEISAVNGQNGEGWNWVNVVSVRNNEAVWDRDRSWTRTGQNFNSTPANYAGADANGNPTTAFQPGPNCPPSQQITDSNGTYCPFNYANYAGAIPAMEQYGLLSQGNYEVSSNVKLNARLVASQRNVQWSYAPAAGTYFVPATSQVVTNNGLTGLNGSPNVYITDRTLSLGTRDNEVDTTSYSMLIGATTQLNSSWALDTNLSENQIWTKSTGIHGYALTPTIQNDVNNGTYNPFANPGSPAQGSLANARYVPTENTYTGITNLEVKAAGDLLQMEAGPLGMAIGAIYAYSNYSDNSDAETLAGNVLGNAGSTGLGHRYSQSAYFEFNVPVTKKLELQLAARYDKYSDFGSTTNPKVSLLYHYSNELLFRASAGTGFKAPDLTQLYAGQSQGYQSFVDYYLCGHGGSCAANQYGPVTSGGNPGLHEEKSISYSAGVVYEPIKDFNMSVDGFYTRLNNVIGVDYGGITLAEQKGIDVTKYGVQVTRDLATNEITSINAPLLNLEANEITGIDIAASYTFLGNYKISTDQSSLFYFKQERFPGLGLENRLGSNGMPPWRNTTAFTYKVNDKHDLSLVANTIAANQKADATQGYLPTYTEFELLYNWKIAKKQSLAVGIINLLNSTPPIDTSSPNAELNTSLYNPIGSEIYATYKVGF